MTKTKKRGRLAMLAGNLNLVIDNVNWRSPVDVKKYNFLGEDPQIGKYSILSEEANEFLSTEIYAHEFTAKPFDDDDEAREMPADDEYLPLDVIFTR